ncbi:nuclear transport factor 2 family protein [Parashewanella curva]|uniref:Nuclear transport factor 2 family protein n=1 Tax=Parashewanella curva TaxID=2338552 RepID=A0A3L8PY51_9GAMM|nr:nuclear transport factor 2 family protein [Parashewanella curva]RLV59739.1 nuclear transport factor 2 family protein [Parashewanella curva]
MQKFIFICILTALSFSSFAQEPLSRDQLLEKANGFIAAKNARQQPDSSTKDIDHFISLLANEFVDEHIKHNFTYTNKSSLRKDMLAKLKDEIAFSNIKINTIMVGANVVFINYTESAKVKPFHLDKFINYSSTNIVSLEFDKSGLIKRIRRHAG